MLNLLPADLFFSTVTSDFGSNSHFLSLDVTFKDYSGPVLVTNTDLFSYVAHLDPEMTESKYSVFMKEMLPTRKLSFPLREFPSQSFIKVERSRNVNLHTERGKKGFVRHYFRRKILWPKRKNEWRVISKDLFLNNVEIEVFDRDGVRVFYTKDPDLGWDGRNHNGLVLTGGYLYIIKVEDNNTVKKGVLTLLK